MYVFGEVRSPRSFLVAVGVEPDHVQPLERLRHLVSITTQFHLSVVPTRQELATVVRERKVIDGLDVSVECPQAVPMSVNFQQYLPNSSITNGSSFHKGRRQLCATLNGFVYRPRPTPFVHPSYIICILLVYTQTRGNWPGKGTLKTRVFLMVQTNFYVISASNVFFRECMNRLY